MVKIIGIAWIAGWLTCWCSAIAGAGAKEVLINGKTMGTTYHISVVAGAGEDISALHHKIEQRLKSINQSMSTYLPNSEINRFNNEVRQGEAFCPSRDFAEVFAAAGYLHELTQGAWDGTVFPLLKIWGFVGKRPFQGVPPPAAVEKARRAVGFQKIGVDRSGCLVKKQDGLSLDFASIAKGFGVDAVAKLISESGFDNHLVEIGGEIYATGVRRDGRPWKIGINMPKKQSAATSVYKAISLSNKGFATSGTYRNYVEIDGRTYSHIIDPRTGFPVSHRIVSASVLSDNCTFSDGLATALMVLDPEDGLALVERLDTVECLIIVEDANGKLNDFPSKGFAAFFN